MVTGIPDSMLKSEDYLCSPAMQTAPIGGYNEFSIDSSVVMNAPIGPDGFPMEFIWGSPSQIPIYEMQGVKRVPTDMAKANFNGGHPLKFTSPTVNINSGDGLIWRDSKQVCLLMTTKSNKDRIDRNRSEAAERAMGGNGAFADMASESNRVMEQAGSAIGLKIEDVDTTRFAGTPAKSGQIKMAGPRL